MLIYLSLISLVFIWLLGHKDGTATRFKNPNTPNILSLLKSWHWDGFLSHLMFTGALAWQSHLYWEIPVVNVLLRLAIYDLAHNISAGFAVDIIGSTAVWDRIFSRIFGTRGAKKKALLFGLLSLVFVIFKTIKSPS